MASRRSKAPEGANGSSGSTDDIALAIAEGSGGSAASGSAAAGSARSAGKGGPNLRSLTLTALLGVFILAVLVAVARHFLPGRFSSLVGKAMERDEGEKE